MCVQGRVSSPVRYDDQLLARCRERGYTPGAKAVPGLLDLWRRVRDEGVPASERRELSDVITTALARGDAGVARVLLRCVWDESDDAGRVRALSLAVLGRLASRVDIAAELGDVLVRALEDDDPRVVREAARAVAKVEGLDVAVFEPRLLAALDSAAPPERRAIVDALGTIGTEIAAEALRMRDETDDETDRRRRRALTLIERRRSRTEASTIAVQTRLPAPVNVWLRGRQGTAGIMAEQAKARLASEHVANVTVRDRECVALEWSGDCAGLLAVRSALDCALVFPLPAGPDLASRIVAGLSSPPLVAALSTWTSGPVRFRLALGRGGHQRQLVWEVATRLAQGNGPLRNDSRDVAWTIEVDDAGAGRLRCVPKGHDDRFTYRCGDVPAASHPTLAAALAWTARPRAGELVWDPFCGSGSELIECAKLESDLVLCGTDVESAAIDVARRNVAAAGLDPATVHLHQGSAETTRPADGSRRPSLIITNPPMGRRVAGDGSVRDLLVAVVRRAARALTPGGRLVWLSPSARLTREAARKVGLVVDEREEIDMGGFGATLQVITREVGARRRTAGPGATRGVGRGRQARQ